VHFLRFELGGEGASALKRGAALSIGIDHPACREETTVSPDVRAALLKDLD
jgi:hypothetical protein